MCVCVEGCACAWMKVFARPEHKKYVERKIHRNPLTTRDPLISLTLHVFSVCAMLELEKKQHDELKMTWQMANDQFLESQRLMMMDMRRIESVLSAEQQRQILGETRPLLSLTWPYYRSCYFITQRETPFPLMQHEGVL